jgi:hypothetical protein
MPRLTTHGIPLATVRLASKALVDELVALLQVPREHFTLEVCEHPFVVDGAAGPTHPFVEVALFDRGREAEDALARALTRHFREAGCASVDVYLRHLERGRYYEDGEPL